MNAPTAKHANVCPKCGFSEWKYLSLIHEEGTSSSSSIGVGGFTYGVAAGVSQGNSATSLARRAAPPVEPNGHAWLVVFSFVALFAGIGYSPWFLILAVALFIMAVMYQKSAVPAYQENLKAWNETVACTRCGTFFRAVS